jgi:transglutaminase-like putative cysteine protease
VIGSVRTIRVRVGCEFVYDAPGAVPTVWQVRPRPDPEQRLASETWGTTPSVSRTSYHDAYGNVCDRLLLPPGRTVLRYDAQVEVPAERDEADTSAGQVPVESLPDEAMVFLLPSRFCLSDVLHDQAWELFDGTEPGWSRVAAVCDWVHEHVRFQVGSSNPLTTALDVWQSRTGVCRDFAHLGLTFCRSLNIPARYVFGYIPDIGVPPPDEPQDFCAWFEAYLEGRWWTFDPRNNIPRIGRVVIGRGRDALDVAMVTTYGAPVLETMTVWADEIPGLTT